MIKSRDGTAIGDLDTWELLGGPKRAVQWKDLRSAKEVARAWLAVRSPLLPPEVAEVLGSHPDFSQVRSWFAVPEARVRFDDVRGETRNTDLLVDVTDARGRVLLSIEAKADESFAETVEETLGAAAERVLTNSESGAIRRVQQLLAALLPPQPKPALEQPKAAAYAKVGTLRYQLLTGVAGALASAVAAQSDRAVFLVHQFESSATDPRKLEDNARDLDLFVHRLSEGQVERVEVGRLYGPFRVPGAPLFEIPPNLYIGKAVRRLL